MAPRRDNESELLAAVEAALGGFDGPASPLDGGITNRNFVVGLRGDACVVRLPGKRTSLLGIDRETEYRATEAAAAVGVGPEVAAFLPEPGVLVTRFIAGRPLTPEELRQPALIADVAAGLRAVHAGPELPTRFDPFALVDEYRATTLEHGGTLPAELDALRAAAADIRAVVADDAEHAPVPCHNDLLTANFLHDGRRVRIVDWEYAGMGDRYFDLANLSVNNGFSVEDDERLLAAYFDACTPRRLAGLRVMRVMSDLREGMWGVVQTAISELDFDFGAYAAEHLGRARAALADPDHPRHLELLRGPRP